MTSNDTLENNQPNVSTHRNGQRDLPSYHSGSQRAGLLDLVKPTTDPNDTFGAVYVCSASIDIAFTMLHLKLAIDSSSLIENHSPQ